MKKCCLDEPGIDKYCANKYCNVPAINGFMVLPFIAECGPRGKTISHVWDCLSSKHDHSDCCRKQGVIPLCLPYCNAAKAVPTDIGIYGVCTSQFDKYRICFRTYLKHHPNIHGDL